MNILIKSAYLSGTYIQAHKTKLIKKTIKSQTN